MTLDKAFLLLALLGETQRQHLSRDQIIELMKEILDSGVNTGFNDFHEGYIRLHSDLIHRNLCDMANAGYFVGVGPMEFREYKLTPFGESQYDWVFRKAIERQSPAFMAMARRILKKHKLR